MLPAAWLYDKITLGALRITPGNRCVDPSQIRYFVAVAKHGSFSAAARALGMTQPGLTKAVRRLEASLECSLFARLPRGVALTEQGTTLLRHATLLDVQLADARAEVRGLSAGVEGQLRIGAGPSWLSRALPGVVAELTARYPKLRFRVIGQFNESLMEALRNGDLDLVVSALPDQAPAGLQAIPLTTDTLMVVARRGHPLHTKRMLPPASALSYPWVLPGRDVLSRIRLEALFRVAGLEPPNATIESDSLSFIAATLRQSDMLSFATLQSLRKDMDGVAELHVPGLTMIRQAGILYRSSAGISSAMRTLIEAIKRVAKGIGVN
jgi:DNA-binding transcriptional LysR family regulator